METFWHSIKVQDIFSQLSASLDGLTAAEVSDRLTKYGQNQLTSKKHASPLTVFFRQLLSPLIYVLLAAVIIKIIAGSYIDAAVILAVLVLMVTIGFI